ncbi:30S ribosomal protein THX [Olivibacter sp. SDN3]|nr:30S ribosomal protein THX [Olivibacter sp. SDN3]QNL47748.1 30S ribosomal protein THX [Olivibacter sp. SDN3]
MGKGDKKTKRGKIVKGSFGKPRPHNIKKKKALSQNKSTTKAEVTKKE